MRLLLQRPRHGFLPIRPDSLTDLAAALDTAKGRSVVNYLSDWKRQHTAAGRTWTDQLEALRKDLNPSDSEAKDRPSERKPSEMRTCRPLHPTTPPR